MKMDGYVRFCKRTMHVGFKHSLILGVFGRIYYEKYQYINIGFKWNNIEYFMQIRILTCRNPEPMMISNEED